MPKEASHGMHVVNKAKLDAAKAAAKTEAGAVARDAKREKKQPEETATK